MRSTDGGNKWEGAIISPNIPSEKNPDVFGNPMPACNRGAMCEGKDGRIYWAVIANNADSVINTSLHLLTSDDKGMTWEYACPVAKHETIYFTETSLYQTPKGYLVAFMRTANYDDYACIVRSTDGGKSFGQWESMGFKGLPLAAVKLTG
ncbi:MAG: glycoside hydrolase [Prevotellaceae bacterium]|nr:glycoside hydrolase [Prevotellaceae bacterium]